MHPSSVRIILRSCSHLETSSSIPSNPFIEIALIIGWAHAAKSAPRQNDLAISKADRIPPDDITSNFLSHCKLVRSIKQSVVEFPHSSKSKCGSRLESLWFSTLAQLVPPAPATSMTLTPAFKSFFATWERLVHFISKESFKKKQNCFLGKK